MLSKRRLVNAHAHRLLKMKNFIKILNEIKFNFNSLVIFSNSLTAIVIFLAVYLVLSFIRFYPFLAFIPAIAYFIAETDIKIKKTHYKDVEDAYPELNEKIRTAADNLNLQTKMAEELQKEVADGIKKVRISSFINTKRISQKIFASVILCFLILTIAITGFSFDIKLAFKDAGSFFGFNIFPGNETGDSFGDMRSAGGGTAENILGDKTVAKLGSRKAEFALSPAGYELSLANVRAPEKREFKEAFPTAIFGESAETYEERILTKEEYEIAKEYFLKITK